VNETKFGTIFTCATAAITKNYTGVAKATMGAKDEVSLVPLVQVHIHPVVGRSCRTKNYNENNVGNEQVAPVNETIDLSSSVSKSLRNVIWTSLNRFCGGTVTDFIKAVPSSCRMNTDRINVYDPNGNWSYCSSFNHEVLVHHDENMSTIAIPAVTAMDWYDETVYNTTCPYMEKYSPPHVATYFLAATRIMSYLSYSL
jgi:hypothetical protein